ncbi:MAG: UbiA family prenyltransferase [Candidatus Kapaibacteriota bacterium]
MDKQIPLVVDLDGTLISTDVLMEQLFILLKRKPYFILHILVWFFQGYAKLKYEITKRVELSPEILPYKEEVINWVKTQKEAGRKIVLATAAQIENAEIIGNYIGIFDEIIATTPNYNLRGNNKRLILNQKFGEKNYDYIGDAYIDLNVWKSARKAILVEPTKDLISRTKQITNVEKVFEPKDSKISIFLKSIRVNQWLKNFLIFVPVILAHHFDLITLLQLLISFILFSFVSSAVYLLNDLYDLEADRKHPIKKNRPLASGQMHLSTGLYYSIGFLLVSLTLSYFFLTISFFYILLLYFIANLFYSLYFKYQPIFDIILLSFLYTIRLFAGGFIANVIISEWLISFSLFFFTSLAILKRYAEIKIYENTKISTPNVRGYNLKDTQFLFTSGIASSITSSLIFILYIQSEKVTKLYTHPQYLIVIAIILILFLLRTWFNVGKDLKTDNPIEMVLSDKINYLLLLIVVLIMFLSV